MAKDHKYAKSRLELDTALSPSEIVEVAVQAIGTHKSVHLEGRDEDSLLAAVKSWVGMTLLRFAVVTETHGDRTHAATHLVDYTTSQTTAYFIPVGPKTMEGYGDYKRFMATLERAMTAADPTARCAIIEREVA